MKAYGHGSNPTHSLRSGVPVRPILNHFDDLPELISNSFFCRDIALMAASRFNAVL